MHTKAVCSLMCKTGQARSCWQGWGVKANHGLHVDGQHGSGVLVYTRHKLFSLQQSSVQQVDLFSL